MSPEELAEANRRTEDEQPWALCVGLFAPHFPFIVRPELFHSYYPDNVDLPEIQSDDLLEVLLNWGRTCD